LGAGEIIGGGLLTGAKANIHAAIHVLSLGLLSDWEPLGGRGERGYTEAYWVSRIPEEVLMAFLTGGRSRAAQAPKWLKAVFLADFGTNVYFAGRGVESVVVEGPSARNVIQAIGGTLGVGGGLLGRWRGMPKKAPRAAAAGRAAGAAEEAWRAVRPSRPLRSMGHARKHLGRFRKIDPSLTEVDVAKILEYVRETATPSATRHGGKLFRGSVMIGGRQVPVHVVETSAGIIKTGFPKGW